MNVSTIVIKKEDALHKLDEYKQLTGKRRLEEDDLMQSLYKSVSKGARVLDVAAAFKETGLNDLKQPRLAIARADWEDVRCTYYRQNSQTGYGVRFALNLDHANATNIRVPLSKSSSELFDRRLWSPVPHIPPSVRPKTLLHNYYILFEVKKWNEYPVDPFLLRRIHGMLFVVEAEWELTDLEAALLSGMTTGS